MEHTGRVAERNSAIGDLSSTQTLQASSPSFPGYSGQDFKTRSGPRFRAEGGSTILKNETVSRKAFALQDKVFFFCIRCF